MKRAAVGSALSLAIFSGGLVGCESNAGTAAALGGATQARAVVGQSGGGAYTATGAAVGGAGETSGGTPIGNETDPRERREQLGYRRVTAARYESRAAGVTAEDVVAWSRRGDRDDAIVDRIDRSGSVFRLSSREENRLRDGGVSEEVIRAMTETARR